MREDWHKEGVSRWPSARTRAETMNCWKKNRRKHALHESRAFIFGLGFRRTRALSALGRRLVMSRVLSYSYNLGGVDKDLLPDAGNHHWTGVMRNEGGCQPSAL